MKSPRNWRYLAIAACLAVVGLGILAQIFHIQTSPEAKKILNSNDAYDYAWETYYPPRGEILDRNGNLLAGNQTVYEVGVDLKAMRDPKNIALAAQMYLGLDYTDTLNKLQNPAQGVVYIVLKDDVAAATADTLIKLQQSVQNDPTGNTLDGLAFNPHLQRSYPDGSLAENILGFVTADERGYFGVEEKYNNILAGVPVTLLVPTDPTRAEELPDIPSGATLILTIDSNLQAVTEQILDKAVQDTGSASGTVVILDPRNGEVLAMATTPRLDPNNYANYAQVFPGQTPFDRAISQAFEPGSVLKILTMAGALDSRTVQPSTTFMDTGSITVGGATITNWNNGAWGLQDMTGCLANSLNVCLAWVATQEGNDTFYTYMKRFGLGHPTGIDLAGEVAGRLKLPGDGDWYPVDLGTNAFGQGVAVTPIQLVMAASAIANSGRMYYPHVLKAIVEDGQQHDLSPQVVGNPISAATAHTLNEMLAVAIETEGPKGLVPGYRIAGKTGTAEIPDPTGGYDSNYTNASFIGWGPVDAPQFLVYVWLEKPTSDIWGSVVAAPVFTDIVEKLVVLLGIPPDNVRLQLNGQ
ncbi:MAG: penicillin-binding protein 2 [Anaerolineales bacterium]